MPNEPHKTASYDATYHAGLQAGGRASAERVIPRLLDLVAPASIVDFGCGSGGWLATAATLGVADIQGVDGTWVAATTLEFPPELFHATDLGSPLDLGRRFDLALCLEVAEHLPPEVGPVLIETLTAHAPVILFSAAVPGQGGEGHVNEAWPSTWRDLFDTRGFDCFDILRGTIWHETEIEPWYRQNLLLFAAKNHLARTPDLAARLAETPAPPFDIAHPDLFSLQTGYLADAEAEGARLHAEVERLRAEVEHCGEAYEAQRAELAALHGSRSWRLTAPLRALAQCLRIKGGV